MSTQTAHKGRCFLLNFFIGSFVCLLAACASYEQNKWGWPSSRYDKVVGYQFVNYSSTSSSALADTKGRLTLARLDEVKRREAVLSNQQIDRLIDAVFIPDKEPASHAVCYDPHHIFVFYFKGRPVAAFEACFRCMNSNCRPPSKQRIDVNYSKLAELCLELGLGVEAPPDEEEASREFYRKNKSPTT